MGNAKINSNQSTKIFVTKKKKKNEVSGVLIFAVGLLIIALLSTLVYFWFKHKRTKNALKFDVENDIHDKNQNKLFNQDLEPTSNKNAITKKIKSQKTSTKSSRTDNKVEKSTLKSGRYDDNRLEKR